jgi:predicted  nucleic acid-binding Zn-ribbon protein
VSVKAVVSQEVLLLNKRLAKAENTIASLKGELKSVPDWEKAAAKHLVKNQKLQKMLTEMTSSRDRAAESHRDISAELSELRKNWPYETDELQLFELTYHDDHEGSEKTRYVLALSVSNLEAGFNHALHESGNSLWITCIRLLGDACLAAELDNVDLTTK